MTRYLLTTLCSLCAACALLLVGGCDYQGDSLAADYGYVQFHLVKASQLTEEDTRADKLEWLSDACKIKVVMQLDGSTITQTLYGMMLMFIMLGKVGNVAPGSGVPVLVAGIFAGLAIGLSALFQGRAGAAACDAQAETNQGFTNYLAALGIVETVAIFAMVFALIALGAIK